MKAGRELDAKVAEFMGWHIMRWINHPGTPPQMFRGDNFQDIPHYSTDISVALPVLEKTMLRGDVFIEWWQDGEWFVCDQPVGYRVGAISANCDGKETGKPSLSLAICRFALKVMEAENE